MKKRNLSCSSGNWFYLPMEQIKEEILRRGKKKEKPQVWKK